MPAKSCPKTEVGTAPDSVPRLPGAGSFTQTHPPLSAIPPPLSPTSVKCTSCVADSPKPRWALS